MRHRHTLRNSIPLLMKAAGLLTLASAAQAAEFDYAGGKFTVNGAMTLGTSIRIENRDPSLLYGPNAATIGIKNASNGGRNQDDANLNYDRGDAFYKVLKGWIRLNYTRDNYGAELSGKAWYDFALNNDAAPWGNSTNGYQANTPLSDRGAATRSKFSGMVFNDANVFGRNQIGDTAVAWKLGWQRIDWGNQYYAFGGLRDLMPVDFPAELRPGVKRDDETRISIPALFARTEFTPDTAVEAFWQIAFTPNTPHQCGTFYSQLDFVSEGCDVITIGNSSDPLAIKNGLVVKRAQTVDPSNAGQFGLALKQKIESLNTEFGLYATQFHSRLSYYSATKSQRPNGPPLIPGDPGDLNPKYFTEYPEDIRMYAFSFDTELNKDAAVFGELAYRPNQPFQYNAIDILNGFTSKTAPTPLRPEIDSLAPGETFHGYERHKSVQLQLGGNLKFTSILGAAKGQIGAQAIYRNVPDLPDVSTVRFRRSDVFGQGPVNGVCNGSSVQCSNAGYVSDEAYGYRLQANLIYPNVVSGVTLVPSVFFGQDLQGWSEDGAIVEGRKLAIVSLKAIINKAFTAEIAWLPTWGGTYNNLSDRSAAQATVGVQF
ncbi:DUF1302 family protein [Jeongeupia wiesaeckerbachi]|uniref:DUF1302 domain-containing protein n=1 Tax=Jeongeupia wiesaeckerbachi TaxID=3051218 RepID=UPI003D8079BE